jgi:DNA-binding response OmpR family regulator
MLDLVHRNDLPTVLLIDDDMVSREVVATVLTMGGYPVHTADDGESGIKLMASGGCEPGVILMDAQMPGLSGKALLEQLRVASSVAIIVISASQPPTDVVALADGWLMKPFAPSDLTALLEQRVAASREAGHEGPAQPDALVVNPETLTQLREMMPEAAVKQIYEAIIADLGRRLTAIEAAVQKNDGAEVRRLGHAIKGGCAMAGAAQAARLGAMIEEGALEVTDSRGNVNHLDDGAPVLKDLRAAAESLKRMLKAEFPS